MSEIEKNKEEIIIDNIELHKEHKKTVEEVLAERARKGCKHCFGRGYEGYKLKPRIVQGKNVATYKEYMPCRCVIRYKKRLETKINTIKNKLELRKPKKMPMNKLNINMINELAASKHISSKNVTTKILLGN